MRELADAQRIRRFMVAAGAEAKTDVRVYLTGGATAVLLGWRASTIDVDLSFEPDSDAMLRAIPRLKDELQINVELAAPSHFIPELPGWRDRSVFIESAGKASFFHYDPYSQALSKIERGHAQDLNDVRELIARGLVDPAIAKRLFRQIEPLLYKYPAVDPSAFARAVDEALRTPE